MSTTVCIIQLWLNNTVIINKLKTLSDFQNKGLFFLHYMPILGQECPMFHVSHYLPEGIWVLATGKDSVEEKHKRS